MKPKAFRVTIPTRWFSKHDNEREAAEVIKDNIRLLFVRMENIEGELPFDHDNITVEPVYEEAEPPKASSPKKKV